MNGLNYKVGDYVRIKSLDWYNENKGNDGIVEFSTSVFVPGMSQFCGKVVTIEAVFDEGDDDVIYCMEEIGYNWTDEMFEGIEKEEMSLNIDDFQDDNEILDIIDEYVHRLKGNECQINLPNGYIFKDENGNEILTNKIILEKKKKVSYSANYEEALSEGIKEAVKILKER
jgi:hypothetical protein